MVVEMQILDTLQSLNVTISLFEQSLGYQDTDDSSHNNSLPRLVQLNIICDQIATSKLKMLETLSHVPHLPSRKILLTIEFQAIKHHIPSQI